MTEAELAAIERMCAEREESAAAWCDRAHGVGCACRLLGVVPHAETRALLAEVRRLRAQMEGATCTG